MASEYVSHGIPFLRSQNVKPFRIDLSEVKHVSPAFHDRLKKSTLHPGDVVVVRTGAPGTAAMVPKSLPVANCADLVIIRPGPDLHPRFLAYFINGAARGFVSSRLVGAVQQHFNVGAARELMIPKVALSQQAAIADVLGALDDKIDNNEIAARLASRFMRFLFLTYTESAETVKANDFVRPVLGGTPLRSRAEYWGGDVPWASAKDVASSLHGLLTATAENISERGLNESPAKVVPRGTTLITARGTVGRLARTVGDQTSFNQTCYALVPQSELPPRLLFLAMDEAVGQLARLSHGTIFSTITKETFGSLDIRLPSESLWASLNETLRPFDELVEALTFESLRLADVRDALLPPLLSGELRVKDVEGLVGEAE